MNDTTDILARWSAVDLGEMYHMTHQAGESGFDAVKIDVEHMKDILILAMEYVNSKGE